MPGPVGIREVAQHAGVSIGTVSNVINKPDLVSVRMRGRVQAVMDELGFVRNDLARQLRTGAGTTFGMIVLNVANPFFADLAHACETAAEEIGYTVVLGSSDQMETREDRYIDLFEMQRVQGMVIAPVDGSTAQMRRLQERGMPVVLFDIHSDDKSFCSVALDGRAGGYLATRHLIETGRHHVAFLGGPLHQVEDRWAGAMRACSERSGVRLSHIDTEDQTIADGRAIGEVIERMAPEDRPDAVFAANDLLALGLMHSLVLSRELSVPRDIAIIGYDDIDYAASAIVPLSTVRQPTDRLATEAVRLLQAETMAGSGHLHESLMLEPELIVRDSTGSA